MQEDEITKGGQGRDAEDVRGSAAAFSLCLLGALALAAVLLLAGCACASCGANLDRPARIERAK